MDSPTEPSSSPAVAAAARRVVFGFGVREIGVGAIAMAVLALSTLWYQHRRESAGDRQAIRSELALRTDAAEVYREQFDAVQAEDLRLHALADAQAGEPLRTWARERARRFDALLKAVDQEAQARTFDTVAREVERMTASGDLASARARLAQNPGPLFPAPAEFAQLRHDLYEAPLAEFSRQNPSFYRAFQQYEPGPAKQDEAALRAEITGAGSEAVTPQLMLRIDLLTAVAAPDDPLVTEWSTLASAMDYFENPDGATLARWRRAQHAVRKQDWGGAVAEMQAIVIAKTRTRQPFRAALGRALLKSRPDQPADAYPYLVEAAATGDKEARVWVAKQDVARGHYADAERWLEAGAADGDAEAVPLLLTLYEKHDDRTPAVAAHEAGVLQRVTTRPDAPPAAWLMLGRLYERGDPPGSSPTRAFDCYSRAAAQGSAAAKLEVARCALNGIGRPPDLDLARDAACAAFASGERESAASILSEIMERDPQRAAGPVQQLFGRESISGGGGYAEARSVDGPGVMQLKRQLAKFFDQAGEFGQAARFYAGLRDPAATRRRAELTATHPCRTCGGTGRIQQSVPCPTCGGKGKQICSYCGGTGFVFVPGSPPCATCGGSGYVVQDRKRVTCSACGGTGKGKASVIRQDCPHCDHGYIRCTECTNGVIVVTKECPDCHGRGTWALIDQDEP